MTRNLKYLLAYLTVTTLLTLGGLALKPQDAPPWESEDDVLPEDAEVSNEPATPTYAAALAEHQHEQAEAEPQAMGPGLMA